MKTRNYAHLTMLIGLLGTLHAYAVPIVLRNVRIIDGNGGAPIERGLVVIDGEKIVALGSSSGIAIPPHATILDLTGKTVLPGLISDHSHLGMVDGTSAGGRNVTAANILHQLKQYQAYGVTTVTSLGLNGVPFYALQPQLHSGTLPGSDIFGADRGFGANGGAPPAAMGILDGQVYRPATPDEARAQVRETAQRHPDLVKLWVDDFHGSLPIKMNPDIYRAVIDEAHKNHLRVAAHVYYLKDARQLVADGIDVLAHGIRDKAVDPELIQDMKTRNVWYIPTLGLDEAFYVYAERPPWTQRAFFRHALQPALAAQFDDPAWRAKVLKDAKGVAIDKQALAMNLMNLKTLYDAGVPIGFGTDSGAMPLRIAGFAEHRELLLLTRAGLTPLQAIGTATNNAAALLHLDDRGVIAPGKLADLVVVDGDPAIHIEDIDRIEAVWHRGVRVAGPVTSFSP